MTDRRVETIEFAGSKAREAVMELVALMREGFTGNFSVDLKEGIPVVRKRTETRRFGGPPAQGSG